jgi:hypothetical protein
MDDVQPIYETIERVKSQRSVTDPSTLMLPWLGFIWSAGQTRSPLLAG